MNSKERHVFPEVCETKRDHLIELECFVRRKHLNGRYYLQHVKKTGAIHSVYEQFLLDCYGALVAPNDFPVNARTAIHGLPIFYLDENQEPEHERFDNSIHKKLYHGK